VNSVSVEQTTGLTVKCLLLLAQEPPLRGKMLVVVVGLMFKHLRLEEHGRNLMELPPY
tara:strand:- start:252 stop:425 length:174 start_codon:yes stop_codon:yes gene_type:complete